MIPNDVWLLLKNASPVTTIIGTNPVRAYDGQAPQNPVAPYVVWRLVTQVPQAVLAGAPPIDRNRFSVWCYADTTTGRNALALAVRNAIQPSHVMLQSRVHPRDPDTQRECISLDFDVWRRV
jgi:hypothetical protein